MKKSKIILSMIGLLSIGTSIDNVSANQIKNNVSSSKSSSSSTLIENPQNELKMSPEQGEKMLKKQNQQKEKEQKEEEQKTLKEEHTSMKLSFKNIMTMTGIALFILVLFALIFKDLF